MSINFNKNQLSFYPDYYYGWKENNVFIFTDKYDYHAVELKLQWCGQTKRIKTPISIVSFNDIEAKNIYGYYRFTIDNTKKATHLLL